VALLTRSRDDFDEEDDEWYDEEEDGFDAGDLPSNQGVGTCVLFVCVCACVRVLMLVLAVHVCRCCACVSACSSRLVSRSRVHESVGLAACLRCCCLAETLPVPADFSKLLRGGGANSRVRCLALFPIAFCPDANSHC
jgi:hypothetical protein